MPPEILHRPPTDAESIGERHESHLPAVPARARGGVRRLVLEHGERIKCTACAVRGGCEPLCTSQALDDELFIRVRKLRVVAGIPRAIGLFGIIVHVKIAMPTIPQIVQSQSRE